MLWLGYRLLAGHTVEELSQTVLFGLNGLDRQRLRLSELLNWHLIHVVLIWLHHCLLLGNHHGLHHCHHLSHLLLHLLEYNRVLLLWIHAHLCHLLLQVVHLLHIHHLHLLLLAHAPHHVELGLWVRLTLYFVHQFLEGIINLLCNWLMLHRLLWSLIKRA